MEYEYIVGVFIQDTTGKRWDIGDWNNSATPDCIAVITEDCKFGIALTNDSTARRMYYTGTFAFEDVLTAKSSETTAKAYYKGSSDTTKLVNAITDNDGVYAPTIASSYKFPSGKTGFLGSLGQWYAAFINKSKIDEALSKVGGTAIDTADNWTSTFKNANASNYERNFWTLRWDDGVISYGNCSDYKRVLAFCSIS